MEALLAFDIAAQRLLPRETAILCWVFYVPPSRDGAIHHFGRSDANADYAQSADFTSWKNRQRERGVTDVSSFRPASLELGWMESHPERFQRLAGEAGDWGFFSIVESP